MGVLCEEDYKAEWMIIILFSVVAAFKKMLDVA
jgi:hypothetical protein